MCKYLFKSERLGFRNWKLSDIPKMAAISGDEEVMRYFPNTQDEAHTSKFVHKMRAMYAEKGYCYFAVDELSSGELIGFIGLCDQEYEAAFTPCVDLGYRLARKFWGKGYATEGAAKCLEYAFEMAGLKEVVAVCVTTNTPSENVMKKIGMTYDSNFIHPYLKGHPDLEECVLYVMRKG